MQESKKLSRRQGGRGASLPPKCALSLSSMTAAMKAQSLLASSGIRVSVIKTDASLSRRGCTYGISYPCESADEIRRLLEIGGMADDIVRHGKQGGV